MKTVILALLTLISLQATASGGGQQQNLSGVYWTPVPAELSQYAVFNIPQIRVRTLADKVKINYRLPLELTGNANEIELEGPTSTAGPIVLTGARGYAECPSVTDYSSCKLFYKNLDINATVRTELLKRIVKTPEELVLREQVAAMFCAASLGGEPCGFLKILDYKSEGVQTKDEY